MPYIVFGGHSPVAIDISIRLSSTEKVTHITRQIDESLAAAVRDSQNVCLEEWDLADTSNCVNKLKIKLREGPVTGIIFAHRFRSTDNDSQIRNIVEVETPFKLIEIYCADKSNPTGSVVLVTSPAAISILPDQPFEYHASKASVSQLVRFAAAKYSNGGKRINGVSPGAFFIKERSKEYYSLNPDLKKEIENFIPLKRMGQISEISSVVEFLCSAGSTYINGTIINVDGGYSVIEPSTLIKRL